MQTAEKPVQGSGESLLAIHANTALRIFCPPSCLVPGIAFLVGVVSTVAGIQALKSDVGGFILRAGALTFFYLSIVALDIVLDWERDRVARNTWKRYIPTYMTKRDLLIVYVAILVFGTVLSLSSDVRLFAVAFPVYLLSSVAYSAGRRRLSDSGVLRPMVLSLLWVGIPVSFGLSYAGASVRVGAFFGVVLIALASACLLVRDIVRFDVYMGYERSLPAILDRRFHGRRAENLLRIIAGGLFLSTCACLSWSVTTRSGLPVWSSVVAVVSSVLSLLLSALLFDEEKRGWAVRVGTSFAIVILLSLAAAAGLISW